MILVLKRGLKSKCGIVEPYCLCEEWFHNFYQISLFQPNCTISNFIILIKFHNFDQIFRILTKFQNFDQISDFWPNFTISFVQFAMFNILKVKYISGRVWHVEVWVEDWISVERGLYEIRMSRWKWARRRQVQHQSCPSKVWLKSTKKNPKRIGKYPKE